ncbi:MAG: phosphoenolpyruvate carboxylase, partial [Planctomycetota bacterium]
QEYALTVASVLRITGEKTLLARSPVVASTFADRNPHADVLHLIQLELLKRARAAGATGGEPDEQLQRLLLLSVNGIAAAMQSTG